MAFGNPRKKVHPNPNPTVPEYIFKGIKKRRIYHKDQKTDKMIGRAVTLGGK